MLIRISLSVDCVLPTTYSITWGEQYSRSSLQTNHQASSLFPHQNMFCVGFKSDYYVQCNEQSLYHVFGNNQIVPLSPYVQPWSKIWIFLPHQLHIVLWVNPVSINCYQPCQFPHLTYITKLSILFWVPWHVNERTYYSFGCVWSTYFRFFKFF